MIDLDIVEIAKERDEITDEVETRMRTVYHIPSDKEVKLAVKLVRINVDFFDKKMMELCSAVFKHIKSLESMQIAIRSFEAAEFYAQFMNVVLENIQNSLISLDIDIAVCDDDNILGQSILRLSVLRDLTLSLDVMKLESVGNGITLRSVEKLSIRGRRYLSVSKDSMLNSWNLEKLKILEIKDLWPSKTLGYLALRHASQLEILILETTCIFWNFREVLRNCTSLQMLAFDITHWWPSHFSHESLMIIRLKGVRFFDYSISRTTERCLTGLESLLTNEENSLPCLRRIEFEGFDRGELSLLRDSDAERERWIEFFNLAVRNCIDVVDGSGKVITVEDIGGAWNDE